MKKENELRKRRAEKGLTQANVADFCHVDQTTVSKWEAGSAHPDIMSGFKLSAFFDLSLDKVYDNPVSFDPLRLPILKSLRHTDFETGKFDAEGTTEIYDINQPGHDPLILREEYREDMAAAEKRFFAFLVKSPDMLPHFVPGDIVIVDRETTAEHGSFIVGTMNDSPAEICRLNIHSNGITFLFTQSDRAEFCPTSLYRRGRFRILGRVVKLLRDFPKV